MKHAIFLDRDNTIVQKDGHEHDVERVTLIRGAAHALASLRHLGFRIIVVANEGAVARGIYTEDDVDTLHQRVAQLAHEAAGAVIDRFYYCPFHPNGTVKAYRQEHAWQKPKPGMLLQAADDLDLDLAKSWMVGDHQRDIEAGVAAGCRTILIGDESQSAGRSGADFYVATLAEAAAVIAHNRKRLRAPVQVDPIVVTKILSKVVPAPKKKEQLGTTVAVEAVIEAALNAAAAPQLAVPMVEDDRTEDIATIAKPKSKRQLKAKRKKESASADASTDIFESNTQSSNLDEKSNVTEGGGDAEKAGESAHESADVKEAEGAVNVADQPEDEAVVVVADEPEVEPSQDSDTENSESSRAVVEVMVDAGNAAEAVADNVVEEAAAADIASEAVSVAESDDKSVVASKINPQKETGGKADSAAEQEYLDVATDLQDDVEATAKGVAPDAEPDSERKLAPGYFALPAIQTNLEMKAQMEGRTDRLLLDLLSEIRSWRARSGEFTPLRLFSFVALAVIMMGALAAAIYLPGGLGLAWIGVTIVAQLTVIAVLLLSPRG